MYIMEKKARMISFELDEGDEIIERDIKKFGNAGHIILPSKHIGKKAFIVVTDRIEHTKNK